MNVFYNDKYFLLGVDEVISTCKKLNNISLDEAVKYFNTDKSTIKLNVTTAIINGIEYGFDNCTPEIKQAFEYNRSINHYLSYTKGIIYTLEFMNKNLNKKINYEELAILYKKKVVNNETL